MSLKNAALLAFVGTVLAAVLLAADFIVDVANVLRGAEAPLKLLASFIHALAALTLAIFFFVFHRRQG